MKYHKDARILATMSSEFKDIAGTIIGVNGRYLDIDWDDGTTSRGLYEDTLNRIYEPVILCGATNES